MTSYLPHHPAACARTCRTPRSPGRGSVPSAAGTSHTSLPSRPASTDTCPSPRHTSQRRPTCIHTSGNPPPCSHSSRARTGRSDVRQRPACSGTDQSSRRTDRCTRRRRSRSASSRCPKQSHTCRAENQRLQVVHIPVNLLHFRRMKFIGTCTYYHCYTFE